MSEIIEALTPFGALIGRRTPRGAAFLGIRYAVPPVRARRFRPPERVARADGPVDARQPGPAPPQIIRPRPAWAMISGITETDENCLTLNVWTPAPDDARRPVLVHVFGGGFQTGSGFGGPRDGEALSARGDIVVVRVNFRIGALGFLHLGGVWCEPYRAANLGLLDLVAALEWVNENIRTLGGEPDNVTVLGLSSGAFMTAALFALPQTRGLFKRAAMQSGAASRIIAAKTAAAQAADFLDLAGVRVGDRVAIEALPVETILETQEKIVAVDLAERNAPGGRTLGIVQDGMTLLTHPMQIFERGDRSDVPLLVGVARDEAQLWTALGVATAPSSENELMAVVTRFAGEKCGPRLFTAYRQRYSDATLATLRDRFLSDAIYIVPSWRMAAAHAKAGGAAYMYQFAWTPPFETGRLGASHGFDEPFLWGVADVARVPFVKGAEEEAVELAATMSQRLVAFVRDGDPGWPRFDAVQVFGSGPQESLDLSSIAEAWRGIERP